MRTKQALNLWESLGKTLKRIDKHNAHQIDVDSALQLCRELYTELLHFTPETETRAGEEDMQSKTKAETVINNKVQGKVEEETPSEPEKPEESIDSSLILGTEPEEIQEETQYSEKEEENVTATEEENIPETITEEPEEQIQETEGTDPETETIQDTVPENTVPEQPQASLFQTESKPKESLGESLGKDKVSMNETIGGNKEKDLASKFQTKPITDIKAAISLGDRFLFIKELFNGNADDFNQTIQQLNNQRSVDEARNLLDERNWDEENETVRYFHSIIQRKYPGQQI